MRNGVKFDATPSLPKIGVVCLVKGKVGALKSEDSLFFFWKIKPASRKHTKFCFGWSLKNLDFFWFWMCKIQGLFFLDINSDLFGFGLFFPSDFGTRSRSDVEAATFGTARWRARNVGPLVRLVVVLVRWDDVLEIILTPKEWESLDQTIFSRFFRTFKEEYVNLWECSSDLYLVCCFSSFLAGGKMWEALSSLVYDCHPHVSDAFLCERIY